MQQMSEKARPRKPSPSVSDALTRALWERASSRTFRAGESVPAVLWQPACSRSFDLPASSTQPLASELAPAEPSQHRGRRLTRAPTQADGLPSPALSAGHAPDRAGQLPQVRALKSSLQAAFTLLATLPCLASAADYIGTAEPMAAHAIYFVVTDRFVNGDPGNDHRDQGGALHSFDRKIYGPDGDTANVGYLGGDFRGLLDHAGYIRDMGFGAVWITPIVDNPDQAFLGGDPIRWGSSLTDHGKAGYHGYWGVNFYRLDEHLPSAELDFAGLTAGLRETGLLTVLDIVANHGAPAYSAPFQQPGFGQIFDADGTLIADHQNLPPEQLDPAGNPLHAFFHAERDLAQLPNIDERNPAVLDYFAGAYLQWIAQGAAAFRVDTIRHMPVDFWRAFAARIREQHPGFYMFGEAFDYEAANIAPFTWDENGRISVLDFPQKQALAEIFESGAGFERLLPTLALQGGPYQNPYELTTFYDNHDMPRMNASDSGFIDAHHWLFTARGIPVITYGSEVGFRRGRAEHAGNRDYFGAERIAQATDHPIQRALTRIARVRAATPALQRGLMLPLQFQGERAAFLRVLQQGDDGQTALVLLNKGDAPARFEIDALLDAGSWTPAEGLSGEPIELAVGASFAAELPPHSVRVYLRDGQVADVALRARLDELQRERER